jgi:biopolymer transport protein ExbD
MAFKPSRRRHLEVEQVELNLFPVMNMMVVLIPLLLSTTQFVKYGIIELNLPRAAGGPVSQTMLAKEAQPSLDLTISITAGGFYLSSSQAVLRDAAAGGPTIAKQADGQYDFGALNRKLFELKQRVVRTTMDTRRIIIQAEMTIDYQTLVDTMDAARSIKVNEVKYELFPEVVISAGIL